MCCSLKHRKNGSVEAGLGLGLSHAGFSWSHQLQHPIQSHLAGSMQAFPDICEERGFTFVPDPLMALLSQVPSLKLTIWEDREESIPVKQIGKLSLQQFAELYSVSTPVPFCNFLKHYHYSCLCKVCNSHICRMPHLILTAVIWLRYFALLCLSGAC